ncbi:MAG: 2-C-methyl-D-erythritol 4-phosphate cytidylyltransferase [Oscillospiraceae bacterium]|nr:2-C-methyl-D-erythritol 4-phosphate cytidylyltransferase [Oscillospiraceae bacterium]
MRNSLETILRLRGSGRRPFCSAVVLAAGGSVRMGSDKILARLGEIPVLARTLRPFQNSECIDEIVVVTSAEKLQEVTELCREYNIGKVSKVVTGGKTRAESALTGVSEVNSKAELIAVHDGARPLVTEDLIRRTVQAAAEYRAVVPAIRSTDTLKTAGADMAIVGTVDRETTWRIQTPQVFQAILIKGALTKAMKQGLPLTDDSSAMDVIGVKTYIVEGDEENIKLTKPLDLLLAAAILRDRRERDENRPGL